MRLFEAKALIQLLNEASPIKELEKAVNSGKIITYDKEKFNYAVEIYKNNSSIRSKLDPFSKQFRDINNNIDIDEWVHEVIILRNYNSNLASHKKLEKSLSKAYKIIEDNSEYQILAIYTPNTNYILNAQNYYVNKCTDDYFTEKPKAAPRGPASFVADNSSPEQYVKKLAESSFYMIPSWCIASANPNFWIDYNLSAAPFPQVFLVISKKHANWRFMITVDDEGTWDEVRDPWQSGGIDNKKDRGKRLMSEILPFTEIFNIIKKTIKEDIASKNTYYWDSYNYNLDSNTIKNLKSLMNSVHLLYSNDIKLIDKALKKGANINTDIKDVVETPIIKNIDNSEENYTIQGTPLYNALTKYYFYDYKVIDFLLQNGAKWPNYRIVRDEILKGLPFDILLMYDNGKGIDNRKIALSANYNKLMQMIAQRFSKNALLSTICEGISNGIIEHYVYADITHVDIENQKIIIKLIKAALKIDHTIDYSIKILKDCINKIKKELDDKYYDNLIRFIKKLITLIEKNKKDTK